MNTTRLPQRTDGDDPRQRFTITVEAKRTADDPEGHRRLRALLKRMLRGYGLRCVTCNQVRAADSATAEQVTSESEWREPE